MINNTTTKTTQKDVGRLGLPSTLIEFLPLDLDLDLEDLGLSSCRFDNL